jgi:hypothetical protein
LNSNNNTKHTRNFLGVRKPAFVTIGGLFFWVFNPLYWLEWPSPVTAPVPFGMNSNSSQLLDLLKALMLGHFILFSFPYFKVIHKKKCLTTQAFQTPTTYFTPLKTLNLAAIQEQKRCWNVVVEDDVPKAMLNQCYRKWCYISSVEALLQKTMLQKQCWCDVVEYSAAKAVLKCYCRRRYWSGIEENVPPKDNMCIYGK